MAMMGRATGKTGLDDPRAVELVLNETATTVIVQEAALDGANSGVLTCSAHCVCRAQAGTNPA
jgi:hypothetical protein